MPRYEIVLDGSGVIESVEREGKRVRDSVALEQLYSVSAFYFKSALENIWRMGRKEDERLSEMFGVQSFLMSITGLEAFLNTYFLLRAHEKSSELLSDAVGRKSGKLHDRLTNFVEVAGDGPLPDKQRITDRLSKLTAFRHSLVHPRWAPSSLSMTGGMEVTINGLVENSRLHAADAVFCEEAFWWCIYAVALVGQSRGTQQLDAFIFHWTGQYGIGLDDIKTRLGITAEKH